MKRLEECLAQERALYGCWLLLYFFTISQFFFPSWSSIPWAPGLSTPPTHISHGSQVELSTVISKCPWLRSLPGPPQCPEIAMFLMTDFKAPQDMASPLSPVLEPWPFSHTELLSVPQMHPAVSCLLAFARAPLPGAPLPSFPRTPSQLCFLCHGPTYADLESSKGPVGPGTVTYSPPSP